MFFSMQAICFNSINENEVALASNKKVTSSLHIKHDL